MNVTKKQDDLHIAILKYGRDKLEVGVTFEELSSHIKKLGYKVSNKRMENYFWDNYEPLDWKERGNPASGIKKRSRFSLTVESTFRLIEYEEFKSANKSSRVAIYFAIAALVVSISATLVSISLSQKQLKSPTTIDQDQLTNILQLKYDNSAIEQKVEEIIKQQKLLLDEMKAVNKELVNKAKKYNK